MNPRIKTVQPLDNFTLLLVFTNGESKVFDVKPSLSKGGIIRTGYSQKGSYSFGYCSMA